MNTEKEMKADVREWVMQFKDSEEEKKINPAWKKLRPNKDAMNYKLPGNFR